MKSIKQLLGPVGLDYIWWMHVILLCVMTIRAYFFVRELIEMSPTIDPQQNYDKYSFAPVSP